jgi:exoribonuclease II
MMISLRRLRARRHRRLLAKDHLDWLYAAVRNDAERAELDRETSVPPTANDGISSAISMSEVWN